MRARFVVAMMSLTIGITGCARGPQQFEPRPKQTRPITIVLHDKGGECRASFGKKPQHAYRGDTISWEFVNTCSADQHVTLSVKSGSSSPFTDSATSWAIPAKAGNDNNPDNKDLDVNNDAKGSYGFDIVIAGKSYDPRLEVDP